MFFLQYRNLFSVLSLALAISCASVAPLPSAQPLIASSAGKQCRADTLIPGSNPPAYKSECGAPGDCATCHVETGAEFGTCRKLQITQEKRSTGQICRPDTYDKENGTWQSECGEMGTGVFCSVTGNAETGTCLQFDEDFASVNPMQWKDAFEYCRSLSKDGFKWRLANLRELTSLVNVGPLYSGHSEAVYGQKIENNELVWSSTCFPKKNNATPNNLCTKSAFWFSLENGTNPKSPLNETFRPFCIHDFSQSPSE